MKNKNKAIITDETDLSEKKIVTEDDFFSEGNLSVKDSKEVKNISSDNADFIIDEENDFYALVSTSDKLINNRQYDNESWKKTVEDGLWTNPYKKPILKNHYISSEARGRIQSAFMYDHKEKMVVASSNDEELPKDVIDYFTSKGAFDTGSGSIICRFTADKALSDRIKSGLDVTVSQSSFMGKATCSICGNDYYSADCKHIAGEEYQDEKNHTTSLCFVKASDFEPIELSIVNLPANDTSTIYCCKKKKNNSSDNKDIIPEQVNKDLNTKENPEATEVQNENTLLSEDKKQLNNQEVENNLTIDNKIDDNKNINDNNTNNEDTVTKDHHQTNIIANDALKEIATKYFAEKFLIDDNNVEKISKLINDMDNEQLQLLFDLTSNIAIKNAVQDEEQKDNKTEDIQITNASSDNTETETENNKVDDEQQVITDTDNVQNQNETESQQVSDNISKENPTKQFFKDNEIKHSITNILDSYCPELQAIIKNLN